MFEGFGLTTTIAIYGRWVCSENADLNSQVEVVIAGVTVV